MRSFTAILSTALLTACANQPVGAPATNAPVVAASPTIAPASRGALLLSQAGQANGPTRADIERVFGAPDITRQDGAGVALTYRLTSCALLLVFTADQRNTMRLADVHASSRQGGQAAPSLAQCGAEAEAHHS